MKGQRLHPEPDEEDFIWRVFQTPGAYGTPDGKQWYCTTPNGLAGNLTKHTVVEHGDGTITVTPSILVTSGSQKKEPSWHGYLTNGNWSEC